MNIIFILTLGMVVVYKLFETMGDFALSFLKELKSKFFFFIAECYLTHHDMFR